jgi:hypothetical protein
MNILQSAAKSQKGKRKYTKKNATQLASSLADFDAYDTPVAEDEDIDDPDSIPFHLKDSASRSDRFKELSGLGKRARQENGLVELTKKFI